MSVEQRLRQSTGTIRAPSDDAWQPPKASRETHAGIPHSSWCSVTEWRALLRRSATRWMSRRCGDDFTCRSCGSTVPDAHSRTAELLVIWTHWCGMVCNSKPSPTIFAVRHAKKGTGTETDSRSGKSEHLLQSVGERPTTDREYRSRPCSRFTAAGQRSDHNSLEACFIHFQCLRRLSRTERCCGCAITCT